MKLINLKHLKPYLSAVLLQGASSNTGSNLAKAVLDEVQSLIEKTAARTVVDRTKVTKQKGLNIGTLIYRQAGAPAWLIGTQYEDIAHHLVVVASVGNLVALVASDSAMRDNLAKNISAALPMGKKATADAFVGPDAKSIWLSGVHASTSVKADSKALTGPSLEHALDPLGDQSYVLSAIRSQPLVIGLSGSARKPVIGVAPFGSRIWLGRPTDWDKFVEQLEALLKHLKQPHKPSDLYNFLSQPVTDLKTVANAYGLTIIPSAMLAEDSGVTDEARREASRWAYDATYDVSGCKSANLEVEIQLDQSLLGTVELKITADKEGRVKLDPTWIKKGGASDELRATCLACLSDPEQVKIYYDSGHAISDGACFCVGWTDHVLPWIFHDFSGYQVCDEKPKVAQGAKLADAIDITNPSGSSLFTFVQQKLFPTGWLACDDGAMELADFVHLDPKYNRITLVHAKGSGSKEPNRQVSVSDYEIVVSQGVKNIRHLTPKILADMLEAGAHKDIARAIWLDGVRQTDRSGMIAELRKLQPTAPRTLMILQPRLTESEHKHCSHAKKSSGRELRFKQLNALMLSARVATMAVGADFQAIAAK
jgi:hypothetical protein